MVRMNLEILWGLLLFSCRTIHPVGASVHPEAVIVAPERLVMAAVCVLRIRRLEHLSLSLVLLRGGVLVIVVCRHLYYSDDLIKFQ